MLAHMITQGHRRREAEPGDSAIARETCSAETMLGGIPLRAHATRLMVHAALHLPGYDHMRDADAV